MSKEHIYRFKLAGVTMNNRQKTLASLRRSVLRKCRTTSDLEYNKLLRQVKIKLVRDKENEYDKYATKVVVWSGKKKKWLVVGFVPAKVSVKRGVALSRVIAILVDHKRVSESYLSKLDVFTPEDSERDDVHYAEVTIKFRIRDEN